MQKAIYTTVGIDELLPHVQALKGVGARFVQMHADVAKSGGSDACTAGRAPCQRAHDYPDHRPLH